MNVSKLARTADKTQSDMKALLNSTSMRMTRRFSCEPPSQHLQGYSYQLLGFTSSSYRSNRTQTSSHLVSEPLPISVLFEAPPARHSIQHNYLLSRPKFSGHLPTGQRDRLSARRTCKERFNGLNTLYKV